MNDPSISLDRLHDIVMPPAVSWWPPAPGWYVLFGLLALLIVVATVRWIKHYRLNAYRREALRELTSAASAAEIAELLRRTALATVPRSVIAEKHGDGWLDWLEAQANETMPVSIREQLTDGIYRLHDPDQPLAPLQTYARRWIRNHHVPVVPLPVRPC